MGFKTLNCPNCGAQVSLDEGKEFGFCEFCGTKIVQEKIIIEHRVDESEKFQNLSKLAENAYAAHNWQEAYDYYTRAMEIKQGDYIAVFRKAMSSGHLDTNGSRTQETISGIREAYSMADEDGKAHIAKEVSSFASTITVNENIPDFFGQSSVENYVNSLYGKAVLLDAFYEYTDKENYMVSSSYCRKVLNVCEVLEPSYDYYRESDAQKKGGFKVGISFDGISIGTDNSEEKTYTYRTPSNIINDMDRIESKYEDILAEWKKEKLNVSKQGVSDSRAQIKALPVQFRILHACFGIPMIIFALFMLMVNRAVGMLLVFVVIGTYIAYRILDKDSAAENAYEQYQTHSTKYIKGKAGKDNEEDS